MNQMIAQMVNLLFQDVIDNEETRALHDELMDNCQEHFRDLVAGGMSEEDAAGAVMESLAGMQEVVDQYPRRPAAQPGEDGAQDTAGEPAEAEAADAEPAPAPEAGYDAEGIRKIRVDAGNFDTEITGHDGSRILVDCEAMDRLDVLREDDVLTVRVSRATDRILEDTKNAVREGDGKKLMDMTLSELLGKVKNVVDSAVRSVTEHVNVSFSGEGKLRIAVPRSLLPALEVNTSSGDVRVDRVQSPDYTLRSASGDIQLDCSIREAIDRVFASSASGDIRVASAWAREAEISSISGDVDMDGDYGSLRCKSVSGDVDFKGTAVSLTSKSVGGDVQLTLLQAPSGSLSAEATSGDVCVELPEDCPPVHMDAETVGGDVWCDVEDAGADAPLTVRARTISGDIRILKS